MRVAITGASGFVGRHTVEALLAGGHDVVALGRRDEPRLPDGVPYLRWDIESGPLAGPPRVDMVVHAAARFSDWGSRAAFARTNVAGTRAVLASFPRAHLVHVSSASVYAPSAQPLREDGAQRPVNAYARSKALADEVVLRARPDATVLRPHAVWGPGDPTLLPRLLRARIGGVLVAVGDGRNRVSTTHVANFAAAVALAVDTGIPGVFNVSDGEALPLDGLLRTMLGRLDLEQRVFYMPRPVALGAATLAELVARVRRARTAPRLTRYAVGQLAHDWVLNIERARRELGYEPRYTIADGPLA